jgi:hypothetical protein
VSDSGLQGRAFRVAKAKAKAYAASPEGKARVVREAAIVTAKVQEKKYLDDLIESRLACWCDEMGIVSIPEIIIDKQVVAYDKGSINVEVRFSVDGLTFTGKYQAAGGPHCGWQGDDGKPPKHEGMDIYLQGKVYAGREIKELADLAHEIMGPVQPVDNQR